MTVPATTGPWEYTGDGATVNFPYTQRIFAASDLKFYVAGALQTLITDYTVTIDAVTGIGNVVAVVAPAAAAEVKIVPAVAPTQPNAYKYVGDFASSKHEQGMDRLAVVIQQIEEALGRTIRFAEYEKSPPSPDIPSKATRASTWLGFDVNGDIFVGIPADVTGTTISAFMLTLLDDANAAAALATLGALANPITTEGDMIVGDSSADAIRLALGASGYVPSSNGTTIVWVDPSTLAASLPRGYRSGIELSNDTDTDHDIALSVGEWRDGGDAANLALAAILTKQIDAAWALGDDAGGMDTGAVANSSTYHLWAIRRSDTGVVDALISLSASAPTMPASYDQKRRLGGLMTNGSANILPFFQSGDQFTWKTPPALDFDGAASTTAALVTLSVPTGKPVEAFGIVLFRRNTGSNAVYLSDPATDDVAPSATAAPLATVYADSVLTAGLLAAPFRVRTDSSGRIRHRELAIDASAILRIQTLGWYDTRDS